MSKGEKRFDSFSEISKDKEEDMSLPERLLRAAAGRDAQNQLARGNVGDGSNVSSSESFHRTSEPRYPICSDMGAEGDRNVVRSQVQQSAKYSSLPLTSNKRNMSNTNDSASGCSLGNKKMRFGEINPNESSCHPLDLSIREASYKTEGISGGENSTCQKIQTKISTSSSECSSSAFSSSEISRDEGKVPVCDVCRKQFYNLSNLRRHKKSHTGEKPQVCKFCQKAFNRNDHLEDHLCTHTDDRPYVCNTCEKAFNRSDNLATHMRIHTGEKPYLCEICQQTFTQLATLKSHKVIHSGIKPHHCDYCEFETARKDSLQIHLKRYHSEHKKKCPACCDYFYSKESLQSHKCKKL